MRNCKKITREELLKKLQYQAEIYDIVRLVEPTTMTVVKFEDGELVTAQEESCFSVWEKEDRCQNCISIQACSEGKRITKFEFRKDEAYYVLAVPYQVVDDKNENEYMVSMELVNRVSDDFQLYSHGVNQTSELVHALTLKSYEDSLTGTFNRRYFDEKRYLYDQIQNLPKRLGFMMIDVNHFKKVNDNYGHVHGDEVLAKIGEVLRRNFRDSDKVIRVGGDEFLVIIRDCTKELLDKKTTKIKIEVSDIRFDWLKEKRLSIAVGVSYTDAFIGNKDQINLLFERADEKMYKDKEKPTPTSVIKTILVVDDIEMNRELVKRQLLNKFQLLEAENGEDALVILKTNHVDLIITDIFMAPMNGYDFMKNVRSNPNMKNIPMIAVTENIESSQSKAIASGADIYINRSAHKDMLIKSIMQLTGHDHGRRELFDIDFVLDSIPGAVIVCKFVTEVPKILYCSRGIHNIAGIEADEFTNMIEDVGAKIIYPSDLPKIIECVKKIGNTRSRGEIIFRSYKNDGSIIWLWMQGRYIGEEDGVPIIEEIILDVSNSTNMYEAILDESASLINVVDMDSHEILYANEKSKELSGEAVGTLCHQIFFQRETPCEDCVMKRRIDGSYVKEWECKGRYFRQTYKKIQWNGRRALLQCMDDITEQKELQKYIEQEKDTLNQIVQNVPTGLFVFRLTKDDKLTIIEANPAACTLMGINFDKTIGSGRNRVFELTHPEDRKIIQDVIKQMHVPETTISYEYRQFNPITREYSWLSAVAHSVEGIDDCINIYISYFDITEKKQAQKLREDLRIAKMENQAKSDFMSNMSHDMRTPLNGILGLSHLMTTKTDIEELQSDARQLVVSGKLLLNLINDTLDMNKIESDKLKLSLEPMDSASVFQNIITTIGLYAKQSGVKMQYDFPNIPKEKWVPVICDASRLEQIMVNIISNAVKYSNIGDTVELHMTTVSITDDTVTDQYKVVDHGIGMSEEFLPHLFEPFVQEGRMNLKSSQGSGLGMSIVKRLVDIMGGEIKVESKINEGTTVTILMHYPIYKGDLKMDKVIHAEDEISLAGMRVLLCEDHPLNRQIAVQLLKKKEVQIDVAENGKVGLEKFENSELGYYHVILMDVRMPVLDGISAAKAIRNLDRKDAKIVPILAMTANAFAEDKTQTKEAGMNEHLAKPVEPDKLYQTLSKYYK